MKTNDDYYRDHGVAIYYKGQMVVGLHPDNVENNLKMLSTGEMKINWKQILESNAGGFIFDGTKEGDK